MTKLTGKTLTDLLHAFSSSDPTPGGGSAAALASAVGSSLLMMVAALPRTRSNTDEERATIAAAASALGPLRDALTTLIDRDSESYDEVLRAYRLPKGTDEEKTARAAAIQGALKRATEVPLEVMRRSVDCLRQGVDVARAGHRAASSDVAVAFELLGAGLRGAALNVQINLEGLGDRSTADAVRAEVSRLESDARNAVGDGTALLSG